MTKTNEELQQLKKEYLELTNKFKELNDDELKEIASGIEISIKPNESEFWHSFNPTPISNNVDINHCGFDGHVENRDDPTGYNVNIKNIK